MRYTYDSFLIDLYKRLLFKEEKSIKTDFSTAFEQRMWITICDLFFALFYQSFHWFDEKEKIYFLYIKYGIRPIPSQCPPMVFRSYWILQLRRIAFIMVLATEPIQKSLHFMV